MYRVQWKYKPLLFSIDLIGNILFFWTKFRKMPEEIKKVLVIRLDHIGDMVLTTPVFKTLKSNYPDAEVHVLCRSLTKDVIANNPNVDRIIEFDPWWFQRKDAKHGKNRSVIGKLKSENYDIILEPHGDPRNIKLANRIGPKSYKIGYGVRGFGFLLNKVIEYKINKHIIDRNLELAKPFCSDVGGEMELFPEKECTNRMKKHLNQYKKTVIVNPGTGRENKKWENKKWARVIDQLAKDDVQIILAGNGDEEAKDAAEIKGMIDAKTIDLINKTGISELIALTSLADLVIAPDTGIIHIARALGVPSIGLFGPVDPRIWGYDDKANVSVWKELPCSFCDLPTCKNDIKNECMQKIEADDIIGAARKIKWETDKDVS